MARVEPEWVEKYRQDTGQDPPGWPSAGRARAGDVAARSWWGLVAVVAAAGVIALGAVVVWLLAG